MLGTALAALSASPSVLAQASQSAPEPSSQMLEANYLNTQQRIQLLSKTASLSAVDRDQLADLKTQAANLEAQLAAIKLQQQRGVRQARTIKQAAVKRNEQRAEARKTRQRRVAAKRAALKEAAARAAKHTAAQHAAASHQTTAGLDLNQTSGQVNVSALANYLAAKKGTFNAAQWAAIIQRESGGNVAAQNAGSGAYGVLQLLGHGEHAGMSLGEQLALIMQLPASAWAETNY